MLKCFSILAVAWGFRPICTTKEQEQDLVQIIKNNLEPCYFKNIEWDNFSLYDLQVDIDGAKLKSINYGMDKGFISDSLLNIVLPTKSLQQCEYITEMCLFEDLSITLIGSQSNGKSTIAKYISNKFQTNFVFGWVACCPQIKSQTIKQYITKLNHLNNTNKKIILVFEDLHLFLPSSI